MDTSLRGKPYLGYCGSDLTSRRSARPAGRVCPALPLQMGRCGWGGERHRPRPGGVRALCSWGGGAGGARRAGGLREQQLCKSVVHALWNRGSSHMHLLDPLSEWRDSRGRPCLSALLFGQVSVHRPDSAPGQGFTATAFPSWPAGPAARKSPWSVGHAAAAAGF